MRSSSKGFTQIESSTSCFDKLSLSFLSELVNLTCLFKVIYFSFKKTLTSKLESVLCASCFGATATSNTDNHTAFSHGEERMRLSSTFTFHIRSERFSLTISYHAICVSTHITVVLHSSSSEEQKNA